MRVLSLMLLLSGSCILAFAQQKNISGQVTNEKGDALANVTISVKNGSKKTTSDMYGRYLLTAATGDILEFTMTGMVPKQITVGTNTEINISLTTDHIYLKDLIITAYGQKKEKTKLGYSAQNLDGEALDNVAETNFVSALSGKFAGVDITPAGGGAGGASNIVIRGYSSITGNNQPLFVVDGVPISNQTDPSNSGGNLADFREAYNIARGTNRAIDINQFDIESISVLKGGAATAMYGTRANNGVILIKTKSGKKGTDIFLQSNIELTEISRMPKVQHSFTQGSGGVFSAGSYRKYGPAYSTNPVFPAGSIIDLDQNGTLEDVSGQPIPNYRDNYNNFWRRGFTTKNTVGFSAGNDKGNFYAAVTHTNQRSIIPEDAYKKISFLVKADYQLTKKLTVNVSANYIGSDMVTFPIGYRGPVYALSTMASPVYDINGPWKDAQGNTTFYSKGNFKTTPVWIIHEEAETGNMNRLIGSIGLDYNIAPNINLSYKIGIDNFSDKRKRYRPIGSPFVADGDIYNVYLNSRNINSDLILSGTKKLFNKKLRVTALIGNNVVDEHYDRSFIFGEQLNLRNFTDISNARKVTVTNTISNRRIVGVFGQVEIDFKNYLFLEFSARNDWSSTLPKKNNAYLYPSASAGFVFSEFIKIPWLSLGKIRASIAKIGNDAPVYATANTYYLNGIIAGQSAFSISNVSNNPNIKPEISTSYEVGMDLSLLKDLFNLNVTYYKRTTKDQITMASLPGSTGYASYILNAGTIENKGLEASLGISNLLRSKKNWKWDVSINFTKNRNRVLSIPTGVNELSIGQSAWFGANIVVKPGYAYGSVSGTYFERDNQNNLLLGDDGFPIKSSDQKILGDPNPDWSMNIGNTISFKNWSLSFLFDTKQGGILLNESRLAMWGWGTDYEIDQLGTKKVFEGIVKSTGAKNTKEVILSEDYFRNKKSFVDEAGIENSSWTRLRNLSLSYQCNAAWLKKAFIKRIVLTASGRNLWISTKYTGTDPESASVLGPGNVQSIDMFGVPGTRSYSFSLKANF